MKKCSVTLAALTLVASFSLVGCHSYVVKLGRGGDLSQPPRKSEWIHHFLAGWVGKPEVNVSEVCGSEDATVKIEQTLIDGLLTNFTGGVLWHPSHIEVYCRDGTSARLDVDPQQLEAFIRSDAFLDVVAAVSPEHLVEASELQRSIEGR